MRTVYNLSIFLYLFTIRISSLANPKAKKWIRGRKNIFKKIEESLNKAQNVVWFHCASLGEFKQGETIIQEYKSKYPDHKILLTFFSPSGFEATKDSHLSDWIFYLPADTTSNAKKFIKTIRPIKAIFIKYEFWFNYMNELKKNEIPFYSASTIFRNNQLFFKYKWWGKQLKNATHFFLQNKQSAHLLKSIGINNYSIVGDSRFDNVLSRKEAPSRTPLIELFSKNKKTIICGSTWPKDEDLLIKYIKAHSKNNYIIAPHEMYYISKIQQETNGLLYSNASKKNITKQNVLIIDNIGLLSNIYQYGDIAYIGGGFGKGIHNILEATAFGLPVIFGPKYQKYNEAIILKNKKGAVPISNYNELISAINNFENFEKSIAYNYIKENSGATKKIIDLL